LIWFLGASLVGTYSTEMMTRSRRWLVGRWSLYARMHLAGILLIAATAAYVVTALINDGTDKGPMRLYFLPGYLTFAVACIGFLAIAHRSIGREWRWWKYELLSLAWLLGAIAALALVAFWWM